MSQADPGVRDHAPPVPERLLAGLTPEQAQAVTFGSGPLLLLAGPGAGKTRTLTHRAAYLLASGRAQPWEILAVTFSVRAAGELRLRLADLLGETVARGVTAATFHSVCARLLREHASVFGRTERYTIYDQGDMRRVIDWLLSDAERGDIQRALADYGQPASAEVLAEISRAKNALLSPDAYERSTPHPLLRRAPPRPRPDRARTQLPLARGDRRGRCPLCRPQRAAGWEGADRDARPRRHRASPVVRERVRRGELGHRPDRRLSRCRNATGRDPRARAHRVRDRAAAARARARGDPAPGPRVARAVRAHRGPRCARVPHADPKPARRAGALDGIRAQSARVRLVEFGAALEQVRGELTAGRSIGHVAIATVTLPGGLVGHYQHQRDHTPDPDPDRRRDAERVLEDLRSLCRAAQAHDEHDEHPTLTGFLEQAAGLHAQELDAAIDRRITVSTIHRAKGTEAQAVALLGCEEELLPSWRSLSSPDPERLAEERRLFYVAATRAKDRLLITHVAERGRRPTGGPSRFLTEAGLDQAPSSLAA